jgi:hypothetical protein
MLRSHSVAVVVADARPIDARVIDARPIDAAVDAAVIDAPVVTVDAPKVRHHVDAAIDAVPIDAAPIDAAVVPIDAAPAPGAIRVVNDTWCNVSIDGGASQRNSKQPFEVAAGHHTVVCAQSDRSWTKQVDVRSGETATVEGSLLGEAAVTFAVDASLDGAPHHRGEVVPVKAGQHTLEAAGVRKYPTIKAACTVRDQPTLDCY